MSILGIDIGGTKTALVLGLPDGTIIDRHEFPTNSEEGPNAFSERIIHAAAILKNHHGNDTFSHISVSVGGPMDEESGTLINPPHLKGLHGLVIPSFFKEIFNLPIFWMHDAKSTAFAEYRFGVGKQKSYNKLMHLTFATGFGCGLIVNGRPFDMPGEIGHWRVAESGPDLFGKSGSLEGHASGGAIMAKAREISELSEYKHVSSLGEAARSGNELALKIFHEAAEEAGAICGKMIDFICPDIITLGTLSFAFPDLIMNKLLAKAEAEALPELFEKTKIVPAQLEDQLGDISSLSAAIYSGQLTENCVGPSSRYHLAGLHDLTERIYNDEMLLDAINQAAVHVVEVLKSGGKLLTAGNGGSATDASHLAEELVGRYKKTRKPLPAIHLGADAGAVTCIGNDFGFDEIFSRQVEALGEWGDALVVFSTSGNSPNIIKALDVAKRKKVFSIACLGKDGGEAAKLADHSIIVPHDQSARIQEIHTLILHAICESCDHEFVSK